MTTPPLILEDLVLKTAVLDPHIFAPRTLSLLGYDYIQLAGAQRRALRVGLDLDGCFYPFHESYHRCLVRTGKIPYNHPRPPADHGFAFYEHYEHTDAMFLANCREFADLGMMWDVDPYPGAQRAWNMLAAAGHELHVITHRNFGTHPIASEVGTRNRLRHDGMSFHSITFSGDKTVVPTDIMVEDQQRNYDALVNNGTRGVLLSRPWNLPPHEVENDGRFRVGSLEEFVLEVLRLGVGDGEAFAACALGER